MKRKYLIRLDDACPTMRREKWDRIESLLNRHGVKPMVGIVPDCKDVKLMCQEADPHFWEKAQGWQQKGWGIALHGYDHCYISDKGLEGLNPIWRRSEFSGVAFGQQREKIRLGVSVLRKHGLNPQYFFAPSHTFDENTLTALLEESDIRIISDTIGRFPYKKGNFFFIPQITGHCMKMPFQGIYTFCFHPNTINDGAFAHLEGFLKNSSKQFISFNQIDLSCYGNKRLTDRILSVAFFSYRRLRGLH